MRRRRTWLVINGVVFLLILVTALTMLVILSKWINLVLLIVSCCVSLIAISLQVSSSRTSSTVAGNLDKAAEVLVSSLERQWSTEQHLNRVYDPYQMPITWSLISVPEGDQRKRAVYRLRRNRSHQESDRGSAATLSSFFQQLPLRRLVVLGAPGAGKSTLLRQLALDTLAQRTPGKPVPVIFDTSLWNPHTIFNEWLANQLLLNYPALRSKGLGGKQVVTDLVEAQYVLPILDGFDELAPDLRGLAIQQLNSLITPLIIASRASEYDAAGDRPDTLSAAAVITIDELTLSAAMEYLTDSTWPGQSRSKWDPLFNILRSRDPDSLATGLGRCLCNPMLLRLTRAVYVDGGRDPSDLLNMTPDEIESHLLVEAIPLTFAQSGLRLWEGRHLNSMEADGWLRFIATHMHRMASRDFAWWELDAAVSRWPLTLMASFIVSATSVAAVSAVADITTGLFTGGFSAVGSLLVGRYLLGVDIEPWAISLAGTSIFRGSWLRLLVALAGSLPLALIAGVFGGPQLGLLIGLVLLLSMLGLSQIASLISSPSLATPERMLRQQRVSALYQWCTLAITVSVIAGLTAWSLGARQWSPAAIVEAISASLLWLVLGTAWGRYVLAHAWLALQRRVPWRLFSFLATVWRLGLLRQVGPTYQFTHSQLQDALVRNTESAMLLGKEQTLRG